MKAILIGLILFGFACKSSNIADYETGLKDIIHNFAIDSIQHNLGNIQYGGTQRITKHFKYLGKDSIRIINIGSNDPHYICDYPSGWLKKDSIYQFEVCFWHKNYNKKKIATQMRFILSNNKKINLRFKGTYLTLENK